ncbi:MULTISPECIES: HutD family protein [Achromobacter]|uniref:HutD family protein n=1 Tax=Achromobacter spanius TaxID=217203 RepID=A0ABY8GUS3_9BURK|nr:MULTISPECIES: HutD family protein [Achromobacter]WAI82143.1 HutD family protein [Achromobacter spanius]WEX92232.1 HutD family protein [Achromobacter sp. SS2-2022]WFP08620.1 HutD family protein [Achromobacter spanius]
MAPSRNAMRALHASWMAVTPEPWKNGGGVTRTLSVDAAQQPPRWRVSVADIDRDGPYSRFPGYDRVSVVLSGGGVELVVEEADVADVADAGRITLAPGVATAFVGDAGFQSRLMNGRVRVLNLFVLRGAAVASVVCVGGGLAAVEAGGLAQGDATTHTLRIVVAAQAGRLNQAAADAGVALEAGDYAAGVSCGIDARRAFTPAQPTARDGVAAVVLDVRVLALAAV